MSTLNNVFKKLENIDKVNQVNLESQRVELALIDDFNKDYQKINDVFFKTETSVVDIFFGRNKSKANTFVQYIPKHEYDDILVYKKK